MAWLILSAGLGFMIGAAVLIGHGRGQDRAWRAIAQERRLLHETRIHLDQMTDDLTVEALRLQEWEARLALATDRQDGSGS